MIGPSSAHFAIGVGVQLCANGETYEFFLTANGQRMTNDVGVFRTVNVGDSIRAHAVNALRELLGGSKET